MIDMQPNIQFIEDTLKEYAYGIYGHKREFLSDDKICRKLGLCDEDLWDMIDYALDRFNINKPTNKSPFYININENDITFRNLAEWIFNLLSELR